MYFGRTPRNQFPVVQTLNTSARLECNFKHKTQDLLRGEKCFIYRVMLSEINSQNLYTTWTHSDAQTAEIWHSGGNHDCKGVCELRIDWCFVLRDAIQPGSLLMRKSPSGASLLPRDLHHNHQAITCHIK